MKTVKWTQLASMDYGVTNVLAHRQYWSVGTQWQTPTAGRTNTAVLIPLRAAVTYDSARVSQTAQPGDLVLIPQGTRYVCRFGPTEVPPPNVPLPQQFTSLFFGAELRDAAGEPFAPGHAVRVLHPAQPEWYVRAVLHMAQTACSAVPARLNGEALRFLTELSMQMQMRPAHRSAARLQTALRQNTGDSVAQMAAQCGMSESTFRRACRALTGMPPVQYQRRVRMTHACRLLESGELRVCDVAQECGFSDEFYFSRVFRQTIGCAPSEYRDRAARTRTAPPDYRDNMPKEN